MRRILIGSAIALCWCGAIAQTQSSPATRSLGTHDDIVAGIAQASMAPARMAGQGVLERMRGAGLPRFDAEGRVQVYLHLVPVLVPPGLLLAEAGIFPERINVELGIAQAWIPAADLEAAARLPFVARISTPGYAIRNQGSVNTQGDAIVKANALRAAGITGAGTKVGVISDGVSGMASAQASGDLPSSVTVLNAGCATYPALCSTDTFPCSEGVAMMEIVHDLAPQAQLGFCGPQTSLEMIDCVDRLRTSFGAHVIVDDLIFFDEPMFEDGPIAGAVATAVANGVIYASSAGNQQGMNSYEGSYVPYAVSSPDYDSLHDFAAAHGGTDPRNYFYIYPGSSVVALLQWNDPFGGSSNDYDLRLVDYASNTLLASGEDDQTGTQDPVEGICFTNNSASRMTGLLSVARVTGSASRYLQLQDFCYKGDCGMTYSNPDGAMFGHAAVVGALAVGAIYAGDPGNDTIEFFSARGPVRIDFPSFGYRAKPDLAAIDGVSVTGAGGFPKTFFGTSAAAPHVAGVAALLKSKFSGDVRAAMLSSATDLGAAGPDSIFGYGRLDAYAAAQLLNAAPNTEITAPVSDTAVTTGSSVSFASACTDPENLTPFAHSWSFGDGSGVSPSAAKDPGPQTFNLAGTFTVTVTCTDALGKSATAARTVTVTGQDIIATASGGGDGGGVMGQALLVAFAVGVFGRRRIRIRARPGGV
jgi:subtilisin family serine protease